MTKEVEDTPHSFSERVAELRKILSQKPSQELWDSLLRFFKQWPAKEQREEGIAYA